MIKLYAILINLTDLKQIQSKTKHRCKLKRSEEIFINYFYGNRGGRYVPSITYETNCYNFCLEEMTCTAIVWGSKCIWYESTSSYSYGVVQSTEEMKNRSFYVKICTSGKICLEDMYRV